MLVGDRRKGVRKQRWRKKRQADNRGERGKEATAAEEMMGGEKIMGIEKGLESFSSGPGGTDKSNAKDGNRPWNEGTKASSTSPDILNIVKSPSKAFAKIVNMIEDPVSPQMKLIPNPSKHLESDFSIVSNPNPNTNSHQDMLRGDGRNKRRGINKEKSRGVAIKGIGARKVSMKNNQKKRLQSKGMLNGERKTSEGRLDGDVDRHGREMPSREGSIVIDLNKPRMEATNLTKTGGYRVNVCRSQNGEELISSHSPGDTIGKHGVLESVYSGRLVHKPGPAGPGDGVKKDRASTEFHFINYDLAQSDPQENEPEFRDSEDEEYESGEECNMLVEWGGQRERGELGKERKD